MQIDPAKLVEARLARAMSQEEAAIATDLSARTIQRIEAGHTASLESTKALLTIFGADIICDPAAQDHAPFASPWQIVGKALQQTSRRWAELGFAGLRMLFVVNFVLVGFAKLIVPDQTGLFIGADGFAIEAFREVPAGVPESLGYWIIPAMLAAAAILLLSFGGLRSRLLARYSAR